MWLYEMALDDPSPDKTFKNVEIFEYRKLRVVVPVENDYKIADIGLHVLGRHEIRLAEHEMLICGITSRVF